MDIYSIYHIVIYIKTPDRNPPIKVRGDNNLGDSREGTE